MGIAAHTPERDREERETDTAEREGRIEQRYRFGEPAEPVRDLLGRPFEGCRFTHWEDLNGDIHITDSIFPSDASMWPANSLTNKRGRAAIDSWIKWQVEKDPSVDYRNIPGFQNYRAGSDGSIWSCWNPGKRAPDGVWRKLKPRIGNHGYPYVNVFCDGKPTSVCNHTLVLTAFLGPRPEGMECCHGLGGRADASLANIRWDTKLANEADKEISGTRYRGSKCHAAKLDEDAVAEIRKRHAAGGVTLVELAAEFGVTDTVIGDAIRRVTWSHVA